LQDINYTSIFIYSTESVLVSLSV